MPLLPTIELDFRQVLSGVGIVAVSGGADSVALLRLLNAWEIPLIVAHLNHRLRENESDDDETFVRELAKQLGLRYRTASFPVAETARANAANIENTARRLRYEWLTQIALETQSAWIATGHTVNDQAETILHRLVRGSGIQGLRGIARERELTPGIKLVRPLLNCTRAQVVEYLVSLNQNWREDRSNNDHTFTRNRIRHQLLPLLQTFNPAAVEALGRLAEQAREIYDERRDSARELLEHAERPRAGRMLIFGLASLGSATPSRLREMFRVLWEREQWPRGDMTFDHWKRLAFIAANDSPALDLPSGISVRRRGSVLQIDFGGVRWIKEIEPTRNGFQAVEVP